MTDIDTSQIFAGCEIESFQQQLFNAAVYNDTSGIGSLSQAWSRGEIDINAFNPNGYSALMLAAKHGNAEIIRVLATFFPTIDINKQDKNGNTALMHAIIAGKLEIVSLLSRYFVQTIDVNIRNWSGQSALILAVIGGNDIFIYALQQSFPTIDPNLGDFYGYSPIMHALTLSKRHVLLALLIAFASRLNLHHSMQY